MCLFNLLHHMSVPCIIAHRIALYTLDLSCFNVMDLAHCTRSLEENTGNHRHLIQSSQRAAQKLS